MSLGHRVIGKIVAEIFERKLQPFRETKRLSESDKAALMGGTLQKVYKW